MKRFILVGILLLATFLRFYQLPDRMTFTIDEEYAANFAVTIIKDFHIILAGLTVSVGFYMGPLFIYLTALLLWISKLNPEFLSYIAAVNGVVTTLLLYIVGVRFFNWKTGVVASLCYAALPLVVFYDQRYWNDFPIPLFSVAMLGTMLQAKQDSRWWIVFAFLAGTLFHFHVSIVPLLFIGGFLFFKQIKKMPLKISGSAIAVFLIFYSPLLAFDYVHNWDNLRLPIKLLQADQSSSVTGLNIPEHIQAYTTSLGRLWYLHPGTEVTDENSWGCAPSVVAGTTYTTPPWQVSFAVLLVLALFFFQKQTWKNYSTRLLAISIGVLSVMFLLFPGKPLEYYLLGAFPLVILAISWMIHQWSEKYPLLLPLFCISVISFSTWIVINAQSHFALGAQKEIVKQAMELVGDQPFHLTAEGGCHQYQGWRYLFKVYGKTPKTSYTDGTFGWLYSDELQTSDVKVKVSISELRFPEPGYKIEYGSIKESK